MFYQSDIVYRYQSLQIRKQRDYDDNAYQVWICYFLLLSVGDDGPLEEFGLFLAPVLLDKALPLLAESRHPEVYVIGFLISDNLSQGMILEGTRSNSTSS